MVSTGERPLLTVNAPVWVCIYKDHTRKGNNRRSEAHIDFGGGLSLAYVLAYVAQVLPRSAFH